MSGITSKIELRNNRILATNGGVTATVDGLTISFAHVGLRTLGALLDDYRRTRTVFPEALASRWDKRFGREWRRKTNACEKLAKSLQRTLELSGVRGVVLWDTMRKGSDFWRPGSLLTRVADQVASDSHVVSYAREDSLCPSAKLLKQLVETDMPFGTYAAKYAEELSSSGAIEVAALAVVMAQAQDQIAAFYCTDPYIPEYGDHSTILSGLPYEQQPWLAELRLEGCHRVVLAEQTARHLLALGITVTVYEVDPTFQDVYVRTWSPDALINS